MAASEMLYVLVVDGVKCSFAMRYDEAIEVWKYNEAKYPEKKFSIEGVETVERISATKFPSEETHTNDR